MAPAGGTDWIGIWTWSLESRWQLFLELFQEEVGWGRGLQESNPTLAEDARVGVLRVRQEILAGGIPLALQAAVRKWVRMGILVQVVDPSNLKQYW
jgi:hypothetical protein